MGVARVAETAGRAETCLRWSIWALGLHGAFFLAFVACWVAFSLPLVILTALIPHDEVAILFGAFPAGLRGTDDVGRLSHCAAMVARHRPGRPGLRRGLGRLAAALRLVCAGAIRLGILGVGLRRRRGGPHLDPAQAGGPSPGTQPGSLHRLRRHAGAGFLPDLVGRPPRAGPDRSGPGPRQRPAACSWAGAWAATRRWSW